ncbi:MAG: hypothetical protein KDC38_00440 [Planctomycetes bacterium]|nr:hypothetical protein [Planctomycetota bacterium]
MLRLTVVLVLVLVLVLSSVARAQAPEYLLHIIPPFGSGSTNEAYAYDVNSAGQCVGQSLGSVTTGFIWSPSTGALQVFPGGVTIAEDGTYAAGNGVYSSDGTLVETIGPVSTAFTAIRPSHIRSGPGLVAGPVVVGRAYDPTIPGGPASCFDCIAPAVNSAFIWDPINGSRNLDDLGAVDSFNGRGINGAGRIAGDTNDTGNEFSTRAFVLELSTGAFQDLGTLRPDDVGTASARAINEAGVVVGVATAPALGVEHAFRWDGSGDLIDLGSLGQSAGIGLDRSRATDINDAGVIVGESTSPDTVSPLAIRHPFVWDTVNGMRDLNDLVDLPGNYELIQATAISNTGWICGYGVGSAGMGFYSAWVLEPIAATAPMFVRGDCNTDGNRDISDAIFQLGALFVSGTPSCLEACDANDDGQIDISDPIAVLSMLFSGTGPLPAPGPDCGADPTPTTLGCGASPVCP